MNYYPPQQYSGPPQYPNYGSFPQQYSGPPQYPNYGPFPQQYSNPPQYPNYGPFPQQIHTPDLIWGSKNIPAFSENFSQTLKTSGIDDLNDEDREKLKQMKANADLLGRNMFMGKSNDEIINKLLELEKNTKDGELKSNIGRQIAAVKNLNGETIPPDLLNSVISSGTSMALGAALSTVIGPAGPIVATAIVDSPWLVGAAGVSNMLHMFTITFMLPFFIILFIIWIIFLIIIVSTIKKNKKGGEYEKNILIFHGPDAKKKNTRIAYGFYTVSGILSVSILFHLLNVAIGIGTAGKLAWNQKNTLVAEALNLGAVAKLSAGIADSASN